MASVKFAEVLDFSSYSKNQEFVAFATSSTACDDADFSFTFHSIEPAWTPSICADMLLNRRRKVKK